VRLHGCWIGILVRGPQLDERGANWHVVDPRGDESPCARITKHTQALGVVDRGNTARVVVPREHIRADAVLVQSIRKLGANPGFADTRTTMHGDHRTVTRRVRQDGPEKVPQHGKDCPRLGKVDLGDLDTVTRHITRRNTREVVNLGENRGNVWSPLAGRSKKVVPCRPSG